MTTPAIRGVNLYARANSEFGYSVWSAERNHEQFDVLVPRLFSRAWPIVMTALPNATPIKTSGGRIAIIASRDLKVDESEQAWSSQGLTLSERKSQRLRLIAIGALAVCIFVVVCLVVQMDGDDGVSSTNDVETPLKVMPTCEPNEVLNREILARENEIVSLGGVAELQNVEACDQRFDLVLVRKMNTWTLKQFTPVNDRGE